MKPISCLLNLFQTVYSHADADDILRLLEEHITENIVKVRRETIS
jgi:hypothetical protein